MAAGGWSLETRELLWMQQTDEMLLEDTEADGVIPSPLALVIVRPSKSSALHAWCVIADHMRNFLSQTYSPDVLHGILRFFPLLVKRTLWEISRPLLHARTGDTEDLPLHSTSIFTLMHNAHGKSARLFASLERPTRERASKFIGSYLSLWFFRHGDLSVQDHVLIENVLRSVPHSIGCKLYAKVFECHAEAERLRAFSLWCAYFKLFDRAMQEFLANEPLSF